MISYFNLSQISFRLSTLVTFITFVLYNCNIYSSHKYYLCQMEHTAVRVKYRGKTPKESKIKPNKIAVVAGSVWLRMWMDVEHFSNTTKFVICTAYAAINYLKMKFSLVCARDVYKSSRLRSVALNCRSWSRVTFPVVENILCIKSYLLVSAALEALKLKQWWNNICRNFTHEFFSETKRK